MRIGVIGAGSTYTPEFIEGLGEGRLGTPVEELVLMDIDAGRLAILGSLAERILRRVGWPGRVTLTTDRSAALDGVDICLLQYRIGGSAARLDDEAIPLSHGVLGQETVGPGGWASALRTIPPTLEIAEELARRSPAAWLLDFVNPVSVVSRALISAGHRAVGLCNTAIGLQRAVAAHLNVGDERVEVESAGLNHCTWYREIRLDGEPMLEKLIAQDVDALARIWKWPAEMIRRERAVPSYYLRYYLEPEAVLAEQRQSGIRGSEVAKIESNLLAMYRDPKLDTKPELLAERGGAFYSAAALDLIAALAGGRPGRLIVNARNGGAIPDLPDDLVVEALANVDGSGAKAIRVPPLGQERVALIEQLDAFGRATIDAALSGSREKAIDALALNPIVPDRATAEVIGGALLKAHRALLPRFFS